MVRFRMCTAIGIGLVASPAMATSNDGPRQLFNSDPPGSPEGRPVSSNSPDRTPSGRLVNKNHLTDEPIALIIDPDIAADIEDPRRVLR